jgi:hypothetical protein
LVARRAHNPEVVGSNPISATKDRPLTLFAFLEPVLTVFFFYLRKFPINFPYNEVFEARNNSYCLSAFKCESSHIFSGGNISCGKHMGINF